MAEIYQYEEIGTAADSIRDHIIIHQNDFPEHVRDRLVALTRTGASPVDLIVGFVKAVYANRADFDNDSKRKAAGAAELIQMKGYHAGLDGRAAGISASFYRSTNLPAGEGRSWPTAEEDPEVDQDWTAPEPPPEPEAGEEVVEGEPTP